MKIRRFAGALAVAALASTAFVAPAHAEPTVTGNYRTYAAVGSDTIQDVWNGLSNGGTIPQVANYNAFADTKTIQTRPRGPVFTRPAGSGNGLKALSASEDSSFEGGWNGVQIQHQIDFSRSSSGPSGTGNDVTYIPFARDAVSVVVRNDTNNSKLQNLNLSKDQLKALYASCSQPIAGVTLKPRLPQAGSGTRDFFMDKIGIGKKGSFDTSCVEANGPENDGRNLPEDLSLIPFSAAQWIAQKNGVMENTLNDKLMIASLEGDAPTIGDAPNMKPGALFGDAEDGKYGILTPKHVFARDTYNVVPTSRLDELEPIMIKAASSPVVTQYGFGVLKYAGDKQQYKTTSFSH